MSAERLTTICVDNLCCASEEKLIRKTLASLPEVEIRDINVVTKTVRVSSNIDTGIILQSLSGAGLQPRLQNITDTETYGTQLKQNSKLVLQFIAGVFLLGGIAGTLSEIQEIYLIPLFLICVVTSGWSVIQKGILSIRHLSLDMNFLMMIATVGAFAIGKWEEGAVVMFLFALAELLEEYAMKRTRQAIGSLMDISPKKVRAKRDGKETLLEVASLVPGERFIVRPGERIPLDGIIRFGESTVNQAPITGESLPVLKQKDDTVFAGSYNERGALEIEATKPYYDTILSRIVKSVEEAQATRAPLQNLVERFAAIYTPAVFAVAVLIALVPPFVLHQPFSEWFYRSLVLLVIACPCALVISTPVTVICGLTNATRMGILIKGGKYLEALNSVKAIAFDKTGTLTRGAAEVTDIISLSSISNDEIIRLASLVEQQSEHHLASAVLKKATGDKIYDNSTPVHQFESLTGKGVRATIEGKEYIVGNHAFIEELKICSERVELILSKLEAEGKTTIILAERTQPLGIIAIADSIRDDVPSLVNTLHNGGIKKIIMLTGDSEGAAKYISSQAGIDEYYAGILPDEKASRIIALKKQYGSVAVVGDGINDAPALATATIGIAMGKSGTDIALESASVVLMSDELSRLPYLFSLSKRTLSIIKQNIAIALVTKIVFLLLGLFGFATLWMAVIADDGATLVVILNGLRMLRWKSDSILN